mmetsp:Transcript_32355/g.74520  ORF Transcript_32355/g.74520 Transcript_32355/m.74520 type:complete len:1104 (-) Transcript_32355:91-3402(-)
MFRPLTPPSATLNSFSISTDEDDSTVIEDDVVGGGTNIAMCADKTVLVTPMGDVLVSMAHLNLPNFSPHLSWDPVTNDEMVAYKNYMGMDPSEMLVYDHDGVIFDKEFKSERELENGCGYSVIACSTATPKAIMGDPAENYPNSHYNSPCVSDSEGREKSCVDSCCDIMVSSATDTFRHSLDHGHDKSRIGSGEYRGMVRNNGSTGRLKKRANKVSNSSTSSSDWARAASEFVASHFNLTSFQSPSTSKTDEEPSDDISDFNSPHSKPLFTDTRLPSKGGDGLMGGQEDQEPYKNDTSPPFHQDRRGNQWVSSYSEQTDRFLAPGHTQPSSFTIPSNGNRTGTETPPLSPDRLIRSLLTSASFEETKEDLEQYRNAESDSASDVEISGIITLNHRRKNDDRDSFQIPPPLIEAASDGSLGIGESQDSTVMETVPSFDYSHLENDGTNAYAIECQLNPLEKKTVSSTAAQIMIKDVVAEQEKKSSNIVLEDIIYSTTKELVKQVEESSMFYITEGIPMFLPSLAQVKVTKVSAHPLGTHVLLISDAALLFSYGSNKYGQLGLGHRQDTEQPEVVISLLEGGGKALDCAAGSAHSLVVVRTSSERTNRLWHARKVSMRSSGSETDDESVGSIKRGGSEADLDFENKSGVNDVCTSRSSCSVGDGGRRSWNSRGKSRSPRSGLPSDIPYNSTTNNNDSSVSIHQVYGFGQNTHYKIGLLQPSDEIEDILLPRRVGLHCKIWHDDMSGCAGGKEALDFGIFSLTASLHHSAALVRRANGATELYTWGYAGDGALGHSLQYLKTFPNSPMGKSIRNPTVVESLSQRGRSSPIHSRTAKTRINATYDESPGNFIGTDVPKSVEAGNRCTFLLTSQGRCISFGYSSSGVLGLGENIIDSFEPTFLRFKHPRNPDSSIFLTGVNIGSTHAVATSSEGYVFTWGSNEYGKLGYNPRNGKNQDNIIWSPKYLPFYQSENCNRNHPFYSPKQKVMKNFEKNNLRVRSRSASPSRTKINRLMSGSKNFFEADQVKSPTKYNLKSEMSNSKDSFHAVHACAGLDATVFVMRSGEVLSCGRSSGRLGQGDVLTDVCEPTPLYGGLHLWQTFQDDDFY